MDLVKVGPVKCIFSFIAYAQGGETSVTDKAPITIITVRI